MKKILFLIIITSMLIPGLILTTPAIAGDINKVYGFVDGQVAVNVNDDHLWLTQVVTADENVLSYYDDTELSIGQKVRLTIFGKDKEVLNVEYVTEGEPLEFVWCIFSILFAALIGGTAIYVGLRCDMCNK